jgi:FixJ family two-component response regulator
MMGKPGDGSGQHASEPLVFVVDDDPVMRDTVSRMVRQMGLEAETFASAEAFLTYARPDRPACLVLDVMLDGASGFDVVAELASGKVELPTIFMTGEGSIPMSVRAMKTGAVEFLTKPFGIDALWDAVQQALSRVAVQRERRAELNAMEARLATLTGREQEVLAHVVSGRLNKEIASALGVVEQTIKVHRARVMQKLGAQSVADLVRFTDRLAALRQ